MVIFFFLILLDEHRLCLSETVLKSSRNLRYEKKKKKMYPYVPLSSTPMYIKVGCDGWGS